MSLLLALGASLAWGVADFAGPLKGRTLGALPVLLWAQAAGIVALAIAVAARGRAPHDPAVLLAIPAAVSGTLGIYSYYRGMATGTMSVVAPIAGASAIVPVIFGIATGDHPSAAQVAGIACALVSVVLASQEHQEGRRRLAAGVWLKETYWFRGVCLLRVAVFTAVMIWRVMQSSAKLRKLDSRSVR